MRSKNRDCRDQMGPLTFVTLVLLGDNSLGFLAVPWVMCIYGVYTCSVYNLRCVKPAVCITCVVYNLRCVKPAVC